ncbi:MAG TPA: ABC transporter ATP-binding protein [Actinomycetes bacterium]|nr:ABC transporter ATP-binding protein [Actinomycetes bacterium]
MADSPDDGVGTPRPVVLEASGLNVTYPLDAGDVSAVVEFALTIREGEFVGLVGESGSGKSTAALALLGLVRAPGRIDGGEVRFLGEDVLGASEERLRQIRGGQIGLVVQNPRAALNPLVRIGDQVAHAYRAHHRVDRRQAWRQAVAALERMGIPDAQRRARAYAHQLSGGMAQRALIAIATINEPRLLVADEPTTGLDVTVQAQILDLLRAKVRQTGSSVLFVTHDLGIVAHYCDRVEIMLAGRVVEKGPVRRVFAEPEHPYSRRLIASAPGRGQQMDSGSRR